MLFEGIIERMWSNHVGNPDGLKAITIKFYPFTGSIPIVSEKTLCLMASLHHKNSYVCFIIVYSLSIPIDKWLEMLMQVNVHYQSPSINIYF